MQTEYLPPELKRFWYLREKYGEYGMYLTNNDEKLSESQRQLYTRMLADTASALKNLEIILKKEGKI